MKLSTTPFVARLRWIKLIRDLTVERGRILLMLAAITVSLIAIGTVLGTYSILSREIATNYLGTNPASATLEIEGDVNQRVVSLAEQNPQVQQAEAHEVILARARVGSDWRPLLLFVTDDLASTRINTVRPIAGDWPPATGQMLIEHTAKAILETDIGGQVAVKTAHGSIREIPVSGLVHDPGLAPANQERTGYGYISRATLSTLGEQSSLHELRVTVRDPNASIEDIERVAENLAKTFAEQSIVVHEVRVPPPRMHPHQRQMITILFMMLAFSVMALVLSGILVASSLAAMLARQVREIGIMKTIGAKTRQLFGMYALMIGGIGAISVVLAIPFGWFFAQLMAKAMSGILNFTVTDNSIPNWVFAVQVLSGILVPLLVATLPIARASRMSIRQAIDQYGASADSLRSRVAKLPWVARNALRRPARLALTVTLLAAGGAMFMTALNVSSAWERNIAKVYETRHYDVEVRFHEPQSIAVADRLRALPGVKSVEAWGFSPAAFARAGKVNVVRTYPDRGHASFSVMGLPTDTRLVNFPVLSGRWLKSPDDEGVVLNHVAAAQVPNARIGDALELSLDGKPASLRLVGIVEEVGSPGVAYVTDKHFSEIAGTPEQARMLRIVTNERSPQGRIEAIRTIEKKLADDGIAVQIAMPLAELRTAMADHIGMLITSLVAMAIVMAIVGALGLTSTMSVSVVERTREFAVMKAVGATPRRIIALLNHEALFIGALSWVAALILAIPLTALVDGLVGRLGFVAPLPFELSPTAALEWLTLVVGVASLATFLPARRASQMSVASALVAI